VVALLGKDKPYPYRLNVETFECSNGREMANKLTYILEVDDKGTAVVKQFTGTVAKETENAADSTGKWSTSIDKANGAVGSIMGSLKTMAMYVGIAFGVKAIVDFAKESIMLAARVETLGVVLGVVGENAGYSKGEMLGFVNEVKKMGITTEAAHDAVIKLAQSQIDLSQSAKLARVAQDAAVIGNINSSDAFQRMINGIRSGETEILKTIGLSVNFELAYKNTAAALGKTSDALTQQEKAQARANAVLEAGTKIQGAYEASMSTAGKMMLSMTRYVEEAKLAFGDLFGGAFTSAVNLATEGLKGVNKWIKEMRDNGAIQHVSDLLSGQLRAHLIGIKALFEGIVKALETGPGRLNALLELISMISKGIAYMSTLVGTVFDLYAKLSDLGEKSIDVYKKAWGVVFTTSKEAKEEAQRNLKQSIEDWKKYGSSIGDTLDKTVDKLLEQEKAFSTTTKMRTAAEIAAEEAASKARAKAALALEQEKGGIEQLTAAEKKMIKEREALTRELGLAVLDEHDKAIALMEEKVAAFRKFGLDEIKIRKYVEQEKFAIEEKFGAASKKAALALLKDIEKQVSDLPKMWKEAGEKAAAGLIGPIEKTSKIQKQAAQDMTAAYNQMYGDLKGKASTYYTFLEKNLRKQSDDYARMTRNEAMAAEWLKERLIQLDIEKGKSSNSFFAGVKAGLLEMTNNLTTWGQVGYDVFKSFVSSSSSQFSTLFEDVWQGKLKGAGDYATAIFDSVRKTFFDMIGKMAAEKVILFFETTWTEGGANILGIIDKVLGFADNYFSSSSSENTPETTEGESIMVAHGGLIPGFASGGDSYSNDIIPARLSPGEYVIPRSQMAAMGEHGDTMLAHINPAEAALLKALGGAGTINPRTGLPQFWSWGGIVDFMLGMTPLELFEKVGVKSQTLGEFIDSGGGDIYEWIHSFADPSGTITGGTSWLGSKAPPWMDQLVQILAPLIGSLWGPGGTAAGSGIASDWHAGRTGTKTNREQAMQQAGIAAIFTYIAQGLAGAGFTSGSAAAGYAGASLTQLGKSAAISYAKKWAIHQLLKAALPNETNTMSATYKGINDGGMLGELNSMLGDIAPKEHGYSARTGLNYVPYDDFPIRAHKGERVLTAEENVNYRRGNLNRREGVGRRVEVNFNLTGTVIDRAAVNDFAEKIYPRLKRLEQWGH
jgi:hypothetical protein